MGKVLEVKNYSLPLHRFPKESIQGLVPWCNGSTTVFGTVSLGSNPGGTTLIVAAETHSSFRCFFMPFCSVQNTFISFINSVYGNFLAHIRHVCMAYTVIYVCRIQSAECCNFLVF